ncbi:MAG: hypothetical protein SGPRY_008225 [Prymnesium sp.]
MTGFTADESKRALFMEKQKKFKKAWRKELSNLEYATNDAEFEDAVRAIVKVRGFTSEAHRGVYKRVQPKLGKNARMSFMQLDKLVRDITSPKSLKGFDEL